MNPINSVTTTQRISGREPAPVARGGDDAQAVRQDSAQDSERTEAARSKAQAVSQARLRDAVEEMNERGRSLVPALRFEPDAETGVVIIKVMNRETGEVIRQLPPEAVVDAAESGVDQALLLETQA